MGLIRGRYEYDYGPDVKVVVGAFRRFNAIEILLSASEFWTWEPNIDLSIGLFNGSVASLSLVLFSAHAVLRFGNYRYPVDL
jgi:hypothetical protein